MSPRLTIGALAKQAGVPTSTVRYYERRGLLRPEGRSEGNYRLYGEEAMPALWLRVSEHGAGLAATDSTALRRFRDGDAAHCKEVQDLITVRLDQVVEQIDHLQLVERMLGKWRTVCREAERSGRCGVLEGLAAKKEKSCRKSGKRP